MSESEKLVPKMKTGKDSPRRTLFLVSILSSIISENPRKVQICKIGGFLTDRNILALNTCRYQY